MKKINKNNSCVTGANSSSLNKQTKLEQILSYLPFYSLYNTKPVVAVLRLEGIIGKVSPLKSGINLASLNPLIEKVFKIDKLESLCLCINSQGGSPVQAELIANKIINLAKQKKIPVYSFIEDIAASGGYWLACAGDQIFASRSSIIGSIGVISSGFGFHQAIEKLGIERRVYAEGKLKSVLDPFQPIKNSDIKIIKALQKSIYEHFVDSIKERRAGKLTQSDNILFTGEFWTGQIAVDFGLIDGIDNLYSFIYRKYRDEVKIEYITDKKSWLHKKIGINNFTADFAQELSNNLISKIEEKLSGSHLKIK